MVKNMAYMCVDIKCNFDQQGNQGEHCPNCGKQLHEVNHEEYTRITTNKHNYAKDPKSIYKSAMRTQREKKLKSERKKQRIDKLENNKTLNSSLKFIVYLIFFIFALIMFIAPVLTLGIFGMVLWIGSYIVVWRVWEKVKVI